ncbi:MAG TPA: TldD/PmbA family protein [Firmicutes bacterium]|nr:TldD/PmbA family protein [Bacillota bacterium]
MTLEERGAQALGAAQAAGAEEAEAYLSHSRSVVVEVADEKVETLHQSTESGLGLRVFRQGRMGFAFTTDLSPEGVKEAARAAVANAGATGSDPFNRLPESASFAPLDLVDPAVGELSTAAKIDVALAIERAARAFDRRVTRVEKASYSDGEYAVAILNTRGVRASYAGTSVSGSISVVAEEGGNAETGWSYAFAHRFGALDPEALGREAAEKAVQLLGAKTVGTKRVTLVFDPLVAAEFLELLGPALSADAVQKGKSLFAGKVGRQIASPLVQIIDDGRLAAGAGAAPVDDEGVPTRRTVLIQDGVLQGFLHNTYTAAKDGVDSTGNGVRASFRGTPEVRPSNLFLAAGRTSRAELLAEVEEGFYVTSVMGMHTVNPISGDFSVGAAGLWLEHGRFTRPVRGVAIAGNLLELLAGVEAVGDDLRMVGSAGSPTLRIAPVTVSGE